MEDFQSYLDKALQKLDVNETANEGEITSKIEYDISYDIRELLLTTRKSMGVSQRQLSEKTGIPQANISKIENGHYLPSLLLLKRLADGLGRRLIIDFVDLDEHQED